MRCDGTTAILFGDVFAPYHQGIFIDIFCHDNVPSVLTPDLQKKLDYAKEMKFRLNTNIYTHFSTDWISLLLRPKSLFFFLKCKLFFLIKKESDIFESIENTFRSYSEQECDAVNCPCFNVKNYSRTIRLWKWLEGTIYMPFEDIMMPVPNGFHEILATQYGENYMTPCKAPNCHGGFLVIDTEHPYQERRAYAREIYLREVKKRRLNKIKTLLKLRH